MQARRGDPEEGYLVVQQMVLFLRDVFDKFAQASARGVSTIVQGTTTVNASLPAAVGATYSVALAPLNDPVGRYWVTNKTSSGFTINLSAAAPVGGVAFDWVVRGA
jgi:hypothetical protein